MKPKKTLRIKSDQPGDYEITFNPGPGEDEGLACMACDKEFKPGDTVYVKDAPGIPTGQVWYCSDECWKTTPAGQNPSRKVRSSKVKAILEDSDFEKSIEIARWVEPDVVEGLEPEQPLPGGGEAEDHKGDVEYFAKFWVSINERGEFYYTVNKYEVWPDGTSHSIGSYGDTTEHHVLRNFFDDLDLVVEKHGAQIKNRMDPRQIHEWASETERQMQKKNKKRAPMFKANMESRVHEAKAILGYDQDWAQLLTEEEASWLIDFEAGDPAQAGEVKAGIDKLFELDPAKEEIFLHAVMEATDGDHSRVDLDRLTRSLTAGGNAHMVSPEATMHELLRYKMAGGVHSSRQDRPLVALDAIQQAIAGRAEIRAMLDSAVQASKAAHVADAVARLVGGHESQVCQKTGPGWGSAVFTYAVRGRLMAAAVTGYSDGSLGVAWVPMKAFRTAQQASRSLAGRVMASFDLGTKFELVAAVLTGRRVIQADSKVTDRAPGVWSQPKEGQRVIRKAYEIVTHESAEQGDFEEAGEDSEYVLDQDDADFYDGNWAHAAAAHLKKEGASQASASQFGTNVWYSTEPSEDYRTGDQTTYSFHLEGFTAEEEKEIWNLMKTGPQASLKLKAAGNRFGVWNAYDEMAAYPDAFATADEARQAAEEFKERFKEQGYFKTGGGIRVPYTSLRVATVDEDPDAGILVVSETDNPEQFANDFGGEGEDVEASVRGWMRTRRYQAHVGTQILCEASRARLRMLAKTPKGFEPVVKELKKSKSVDNPWAVAWSMKNRGIKPKAGLGSKFVEAGAKEKCQTCGTRLDPEKGEVFLTDDGGIYCNDCYPENDEAGVDEADTVQPFLDGEISAAEMSDDDIASALAILEDFKTERPKRESPEADEDVLAMERDMIAELQAEQKKRGSGVRS